MKRPLAVPPDPGVEAIWALEQAQGGAPFVLRRFVAQALAAEIPLQQREDARLHVPADALRIKRSAGDQVSLVDAWVEVADPELRELLLSDPEFAAYAAG